MWDVFSFHSELCGITRAGYKCGAVFFEGAKAVFFFVVASLAGYCLAYGRLPHR